MNFPFSFDYCHIHVSQTPKMSGDKIRIIGCGKKCLIEMFGRHESYIWMNKYSKAGRKYGMVDKIISCNVLGELSEVWGIQHEPK